MRGIRAQLFEMQVTLLLLLPNNLALIYGARLFRIYTIILV